MTQILETLFGIFVCPGFIFSLIVGGLFYWFSRKLRARLQARIGPPWYQFFADVTKLFSKGSIIPSRARGYIFVLAPIFSIIGLLLVVVMLPIGACLSMQSSESLIMAMYFLAFPGLALIIAGVSSGSPYGAVGASREARMMVGYELPYVISALTLAFHIKSLDIMSIVNYQFENGAFLLKYPLASIASVICLLPKICRRPFDAPEADTEIIGGPLTEYSGIPLGLFELVNALKWFIFPAFAVTLFFGGGTNIIEFLLKCLGLIILITIIDVIYPRFRIDQSFKFLLKIALPLAIIDLLRSVIWI